MPSGTGTGMATSPHGGSTALIPTPADEKRIDRKRLLTVAVKLLEVPQSDAKIHPITKALGNAGRQQTVSWRKL